MPIKIFQKLSFNINKLINFPLACLLYCFILTPTALQAQSKFAGESFSVGVGGRGLAMGSAYHTLASGAEALFWNPAGLARVGPGTKKNNVVFMHSERFGGEVAYNFLGFSRQSNRGSRPLSLGLGLIHLGVGGIPVTTRLQNPDDDLGGNNRPIIDKFISKNDFALLAGAGREFGDGNFIGANVKILHQRYLDVNATGFGFDLGVIYSVDFGLPLLLSASARDATTSFLAFSTGKREYIRPWVSVGVALAEGIALASGKVSAAVELSAPLERRKANYGSSEAYLMSLVHLGFEYALQDRLFLRGGLDERNPTFGAGFFLRELAVDYAWIGHRDLDQTHRVSLGYGF